MAKIFIVEDEYMSAIMLETLLREAGFEVPGHASTAEEALPRVLQERPDVVLVDVALSGKTNGLDLVREIRLSEDPSIIFTTGFSDEEMETRIRDLNPEGVLVKPLTFSEVKSAIDMALKNRHPI